MSEKVTKKTASYFAKTITTMCVRNDTSLERFHVGCVPVSKTGDYSDVKVIDAEGNEIPWNELSRISQDEMKKFMKEVVNNVYTYFMLIDHADFFKFVGFSSAEANKWDSPKIKKSWIQNIDGKIWQMLANWKD